MGVNNSLLKSIQTIVDKAIEIAPFDKTRQAQIITNNGDGSYTVRLDGILYNNVPSYPKTNIIEVGTIVKVMTPGNQSSQMYIQSSKGGSGGGGDHRELTRAEYEALTPEQKNDGTVYFVTDGDPDYFIMSDSVPIGAIQAFGGETAPEGWLICDGSVVSRETYSDLFKVIGTTYGSGDGSTTFNLPDLRGKIAIGVNTDHAIGSSGGEETHLLTNAELPKLWGSLPHIAYGESRVGGVFSVVDSGSGRQGAASPDSTSRHYELNIGGDIAHNNMQPYIVTNYIIKAFQPPTDNVIKNLDPQSLVLDAFYPVGSCYETTNTQFNPNIVWGGTWELLPEGTIILAGSEDGTYQVGTDTSTGSGYKEYGSNTHTLTNNELPVLTGYFQRLKWSGGTATGVFSNASGGMINLKSPSSGSQFGAEGVNFRIGNGEAHSIMQKSIAMYIWIRTA